MIGKNLAIMLGLFALICTNAAFSQENDGPPPPDGKGGTRIPEETLRKLTQPMSSEELQAVKQRSVDAWNVQALSSPPNLANFPMPTGGARFLRGQSFPKMMGGPLYVLSYACPAGAPEMMRWYAEALRRYGWEVDKPTGKSVSLAAKRERDTCTVTFYGMNRKTYKSTLEIKYQQSSP